MDLRQRQALRVAILVAVVLFAWIVYYHSLKGAGRPLVVYCAHDSIYSEAILDAFERRTGIRVSPRFDTEATKSLGLVELIVREKNNPRCDVFWNNELLGTMDLQQRGLLEPYRGRGFERIPPAFRDAEGHWAGFGARLRVFIVNTNQMNATDAEISGRLEGDLSRVAMARPLYGTTLTHYCVLWQQLGAAGLKAFHDDTRRRGLQEVTGNSTVKNLVAEGVCDFGYTDSDDFFVAKDTGHPVDMFPVTLSDGRAICIPNTVAMIRGTQMPRESRMLVDYLLSEPCETALANSSSRQIPLGPVDEDTLNPEVLMMKHHAASAYPIDSLLEVREQCLNWLKSLP
jgi:iron(III) transport system substrate-binding protein